MLAYTQPSDAHSLIRIVGFIDYIGVDHQLFAIEHLVKRVTNCLSLQTRSRMTRFAS